jgi:hypothetical protein
VQAVCAYYQAKRTRRRVLERDIHPVWPLAQAGDRVAEQVLHIVPRRLVENLAKVAAQDLDIPGEQFGSVPGEPVGECGPGDAGAGDQNVHGQNHTYV